MIRKAVQCLMALLFVLFLATTTAAADDFFVSTPSARDGMLMSLSKNEGVVQPATTDTAATLVGVLDGKANDLAMQPGQSNIVTSGVAQTMVSTLQGNIVVGDRIAPSSLVGIGAKSTANGWVMGVAQGSLDPTSKNATKTTVTDNTGNKHAVYVAIIPVQIKITYYSAQSSTAQSNSTIQSIADTVAGGKHVSQHAIIVAGILLLAGLVIAGMILNASVRGGLMAIGRQPLARRSIMGGMLRSVLLAVGMLAIACIAAALILRLL